MVHWIEQKSLKVVDTTLVDTRPRGMAFTADSKQLWVTSELGGTATVIDTETRKIIKTIQFEIPGVTKDMIQPVGVAIDQNRKWAFVAWGREPGRADNAQTPEVENHFLVGRRFWNQGRTHKA